MISTVFEKKYGFGKKSVTDEKTEEGTIRTLLLNGARESACYVDEGRHYDLRFAYNHEFARMLSETERGRRVLLIGGAGFSLPKYFISTFPTGRMDVVELHREMRDIAMKYFFLDELYLDYHPDRTGRLKVFCADGSRFIEDKSKAIRGVAGFIPSDDDGYDMVIDDAFAGKVHDEGMLSDPTVSCICDILKPDGVYAANVISPAEGYGSMPLIMAKSILKNHFKTVKMWQVNRDRDPKERQNCILYAKNPIIR